MNLIRVPAALILAGSAFLADPAAAQGICPPAQQCPNGSRLPFPVINPVQGLNSLTQHLRQQREQPQQPAQPVPWNYVPVATPPQGLAPELQR
jgi:hypothetical protein